MEANVIHEAYKSGCQNLLFIADLINSRFLIGGKPF